MASFVFDGLTWKATASASADCLLEASWPAIWTYSEPLPFSSCLPLLSCSGFADSIARPPCTWSMDCFVSLPFNAAPIATASFDCVTSPPLPGLRTRIDEAVLLGFH